MRKMKIIETTNISKNSTTKIHFKQFIKCWVTTQM
jgi:hypothetical protein